MVTAKADDAAACLRDQMGFTSDGLPSLDSFFGAVDGKVTSLASMSETERSAAIGTLDDEASAAFLDCTTDTYETFAAKLTGVRPAFLDRHNETIAGLAGRRWCPKPLTCTFALLER